MENVKGKIVTGGHAPEVSRIKLIHTGRIMSNDKTLGDYGVKEGDHMVLMVTQPPSQVKPTTATPLTTCSIIKPSEDPTQKESSKEELNAEQSEISLEESPEFQQAVQSILEMGYSDKQIVNKALRIAYGNPDKAVELLESV